nr:XRE family transcriptional regulator [uncultured Campylobacter sp.]
MDLSETIRKARLKADLTQVQLAEKLGVTQGTITQYETKPGELDNKGKPKKSVKPSLDKLPEMAEVLNLDVTDFFDNSAAIKKNIVKKELKDNFERYAHLVPEDRQLKDAVLIPKLQIVAGAGSEGFFDVAMLNTKGYVPVERHIIGKLSPENLRAIEVVGDSMEPEFYEGDVAIIDMVNHRYDFIKIAGVYVVRSDEAVYIKKVEFMPKGGIRMMSINRSYGDITISPDENFEILGKVCGKVHYEIYKGLVFDNQGIK